MNRPVIETERLLLRPFTEADVTEVARLAGDAAIADTTLNIPHPYSEEDARTWIATHEPGFRDGVLVNFAIEARGGPLVGSVGLTVSAAHRRAEIGYWVGREHWGRGYATEAALAAIRYGFEDLALLRIHAFHMARNPASGRVMEKLGMKPEGVLRRHLLKHDRPEDIRVWGILSEEFSGDGRSAGSGGPGAR